MKKHQFIYAGSVFETEAGFHAFYTGYNREFLKAGKTSQTLLHATSKDGITWEKSKEALEIPPQEGYDKRNWRDPFVLWDDEREEYFTLHQGDIIIKSAVEDEIDECTKGKRSTDFLAKYKETGECFVVKSWQDNTGAGRCAPHYYVSGE